MEAPEKLYLSKDLFRWSFGKASDKSDIEYIRKDVVDDMLATAEDHAYFAGSEHTREKLVDAFIEKAENFIYCALNDGIMGTCNIEDFLRLFETYMKGE